MNSRLKTASACLALFVLAESVLADPKPQETLEAVKQLRAERKTVQASEKAKAGLKDVDPAKVDLTDAAAWAELYSAAQDYKGLQTLAQRWAAKAEGAEKFKAQMQLVNADGQLKDTKALTATLTGIKPGNATEAYQLAATASRHVNTAFLAGDKESGMKLLTFGESVLPKEGAPDILKPGIKATGEQLAKTRKLVMDNPGKEAEVIKAQQDERMKSMANLLTRRPAAPTDPVAAAKARKESEAAKFAKFLGQDAAEIKATKVLGDFKGISSLKGKVVVLDFFAHWCGPCKAALPSVRALYDDLKGKGLEVVGVTKFYGYYGTESRTAKDMTPDTEYERMKGFLVDQKINWPVVFVDSEVFKAYGASAIPHVVVIDKTGKIHKIKVGYYPAEIKAFHAEIEKLLEG